MAVLCVSTIRASFLTHVLCIFVFRRVECRHSSFRIFLALCAMIGLQVLTGADVCRLYGASGEAVMQRGSK